MIEDKNLLLALALKNKGGGSGSYIETVTFFSGNATVVRSTGDPDQGEIYLEGVEGLDFSVKTVELAMEKDDQTKVVTLMCDSMDPIWFGNDGENTYSLNYAGDNYYLYSSLFNESVIGEAYNITLSTENVEPNFQAAVEKASNSIFSKTLNIPVSQATFLQLVTSGHATIDITQYVREAELTEDNALSCYIALVTSDGTTISLEPAGMWGAAPILVPNYRAWIFDLGYSTSPSNLNFIYAHILFGAITTLYIETGHVAVTAGLATN